MSRAFLSLIAVSLFSQSAAGQFSELAAKIPDSANAIVLLDGPKLLTSPLATKEKWKEQYEQAFAAGLVSISPDTQQLILASQIDYEFMRPVWEAAVGDLGRERPLADVARATKGTLDPIGNTPAIALRDNAFLVAFGPKRLGVMSPANRQSVARWVREAGSRTQSALSPYLQGALTASQTSGIVMAFDLQDAVPPDVIRAKLASSPALSGKNIDLEAATKALAGIRGLSLEVAVTDATYGRLMVHFSSDASVLTPVAKPLLLEVLGNLGATVEDLASWQVESEPQKITFRGQLSAAGRKRVFSLIDHPTSMLISSDSEAATSQQPSRQVSASQQYFKSINSILDDIRETSKNAKTFGESALWFDKWARRIDRLPLLNVDPELLQYGRDTAGGLRSMAAAIRGITIQSGARTAQIYGSGSYTPAAGEYGNAGFAEWREVDSQRRAVRAEEKAKGALSARDMASQIAGETARIRQAMSQKYQAEF